MFPFWDLVIAPIFDAVDAKRVVEIGALRGENTVQVLDHLSAESELHVIDPVPAFDPAEHARQFGGRYIFHQALSLDALPDLPPMDIALIDGDHNWYTVYNELKLIAGTAREAGLPMPVMILHDVGWPYGRRDLYYAPDTIPDEHRQPWATKGIEPGVSELLENGGLNPAMCNALTEGGPRNGVMTAVDDFVAEYDRPLRLLVLPIYFGLAIVVEEDRLAAEPALAAELDRLETAEGRFELMELAEATRMKAMLFQHQVYYHGERLLQKGTRRYLDLLKGALLDEHYLENELRINYLATCIANGWEPSPDMIRDPVRQMKDKNRKLRARAAGAVRDESGELTAYFPYTTMGRTRLDHLERCLDAVRTEEVPGDVLDCGAGRGGAGVFMRGYLEIWNVRGRKVFVADTFQPRRAAPASAAGRDAADGAPAPESGDDGSSSRSPGEMVLGWNDSGALSVGGADYPGMSADLNQIREAFKAFDLFDIGVRFLQGRYAETLPDAPFEALSLVRLGPGLGADAVDVLDAVYDRLSPGGFVIVDDYGIDPEVQRAVDQFRSKRGIDDQIERADWSAIQWRRATEAPTDGASEPTPAEIMSGTPDRAPLAPDEVPESARRDLSVVVVFYNMKREAARTLHSLSRSYQQGLDDATYEVVVVENGSDPDQVLGDDYVRSFGPEFRYLNLGEEAQPSPAHALNRGMEIAGGDAICFMIDGAHVLTPGVLRYGLDGLRTYAPSVVGTQLWYVGPGQQGDAMLEGYDQDYEDRLFDEIAWPTDGYRLFDIGHFIGDRDWFDGLWESNCFFVPRDLLAQVGGFDESFSVAGGGYTNLDLYERFTASPDVSVTTILGEGSFHQTHGGTTTNQPSIEERRGRIASYAEHYEETRGRPFRGAHKTLHYVGTMFHEACRTKARRSTATALFKAGSPNDPDGEPTSPMPLPDDLQVEFTDAYWRSLRWQQQSQWLGQRAGRPPTDLFAYQELISRVRPEFIIETGTASGGRTLFLAGICELLGRGRVISIDAKESDRRPQHPRITYLTGMAFEDPVVEQVRALTGGGENALAILGTHGRRLRMMNEFEAFKPFIPIGSYIIIEDTILNGHPVYPSFGPGPAEAVKQLLGRHHDFISDTTVERHGLSFNPGGFLRRVK